MSFEAPPSLLLAIETAGAVCGAALWANGLLLGAENVPSAHGHAKDLAPLIARIAKSAKADLSRLSLVAATVGPGGFTGIRAGLAMARGLALGAGCRAVGIDAFQRLAQSAKRSGQDFVGPQLLVIDSRREELFAAVLNSDLRFQAPPFLTKDPIGAARQHRVARIVTDVTEIAGQNRDSGAIIVAAPMAEAVGELAERDAGAFLLAAEPRYLRAPDVSQPMADRKAPEDRSTGALEIRDAGIGDFPVVAAINRAAFANTTHQIWSDDALGQSLALPTTRAWMSVENGVPTGLALVALVVGEAELLLIGVIPEARRKGHGRALLDHACRMAAKMGARRIHLEFAKGSEAARLYQRAGFVEIGLRPDYYRAGGHRRDAILMAKNLD